MQKFVTALNNLNGCLGGLIFSCFLKTDVWPD